MFKKSVEGYYDAILMDIRMPVLDGMQATKKIRGLNRKDATKIPIIAMTANAYQEDVKQCIDAGMNEHIAKPIEPEIMYEIIASVL
jgi:CheY-like chemotaxis protein